MGFIRDTVNSVKSIQIRPLLNQAVTLSLVRLVRLLIPVANVLWLLNAIYAGNWKSYYLPQSLYYECMIVTSVMIMGMALMCFTGSQSPVAVVLSESMEPGFKRGDILFFQMSKDPIRSGEIVIFNIDGREIPIVHRVIKVHERQDGEVDVLTKGDNNDVDDKVLYAKGQLWLQRHHIMGRAVGFLPYVGWVIIILTEKPIIKYILNILIGPLALLVIT